MLKCLSMRATKAVINTTNLKNNLNIIKKLTKNKKKICLAVKADGYGHNAVTIGKAVQEYGVDYLGVATVSEALELRKNGIVLPILLFSPALAEELELLFSLNIESIIYTENDVKEYCSLSKGRILKVHLKIDTGMRRIGCAPEDALKLAKLIEKSAELKLSGVSTHFPVSDSSKSENIIFTKEQIKTFLQIISDIKKAGIDTGIIHAANSGAILNYPEAHFDMVRPGIIAYGYLPGGRAGLIKSSNKNINLKPVMSFESKIVHIKKVKKGESVSYGRSYKAEKDTWIGTIPAGYADGYTRIFSNQSKVLINGKLYPVVGTICMDQFMVDLGENLMVNLYDRVILFGYEKNAPTAETLTSISKSIPYELLCSISKRVPRVTV